MATSEYTPNLQLSKWTENDRPKRADFVSDNNIIDTQLGGHLANSAIHVTAEEKEKISAPAVPVIYAGSGESTRTITLGFQPKLVLVYKRGVPPVTYSGGAIVVNAAVGYYGYGTEAGLTVNTSGVVVTQASEASNGVRMNLNESGAQYTVVAFK